MDTRHLLSLMFVMLVLSSTAHAESYVRAELYGEEQLRLVTAGQREVEPPKEEGQVGFESPQLSPDNKTVGWLTLHPNCCTSYPIPLSLVLYRGGKVIQTFKGINLPIWKWCFDAGGARVAFWQSPTHGNYQPHFELRSVRSGKLIEAYDGESGEGAPGWVRRLFPQPKNN